MSPAVGQRRLGQAFGEFRLHATPAADVWHARGTLALHAVGPRATATVAVDAGGLRPGGVAGLALFNRPYAWLGVERLTRGFALAQFDERTGQVSRVSLARRSVILRAECDLARHVASFHYSVGGTRYRSIGVPHALTYDVAIPCAVFCVGPPAGPSGGHADFAEFVVLTPAPQVPSERAGRASGRRTDTVPRHAARGASRVAPR